MSEETALTAFNKILEESRYMDSAKRVSRHLHLPRARTPLQETGGKSCSLCTACIGFATLLFMVLQKYRHLISGMCHAYCM